MLKNHILNLNGTNWLVREAVSEEAARNAIASARVMGSIGGKETETGTDDVKRVLADVVRLNADGTECTPYGEGVGTDHSALVALSQSQAHNAQITRALDQSGLRNRVYAGALADIEALVTGDMPIHHDAAFLRAEIAKAIAGARATISEARAAAQADTKAQ